MCKLQSPFGHSKRIFNEEIIKLKTNVLQLQEAALEDPRLKNSQSGVVEDESVVILSVNF